MNTFRWLVSAKEFRVDSLPTQDRPRSAKALRIFRLLTLVALFGLVTGCGGNPTQPPANIIAFESFRALDGSDAVNGASNIWVAKADGSGATPLTRLTGGGESVFGPVWSSEGSKLAFLSTRALDGSNAFNANGTFNVWVMNADGSGATPLTRYTSSGPFRENLAWSPDGGRIAFVSDRALDGSDTTINAVNIWVADGSGAIPLTRFSAHGVSNPVWSPDGGRIAFSSNGALDGSDAAIPGGSSNLWVINADGSGATPLTRFAFSGNLQPVFSTDGTKLAFLSNRGLDGSDSFIANSNLWVANADGSGTIPLTKYTAFGAGANLPRWSPDSKKLAFTSSAALDGSDAVNTNSTSNVWVANADGSGVTPMTRLTYSGARLSVNGWSPDGANLVFDSDRALDGSNAAGPMGTFNVWVVKADGSSAMPSTKLTVAGADSLFPAWKP